MDPSAAILSVVVALALGTISPGPSFLMVARTALAVSRKNGLAAAVGMGVGGVVFSGIALLGLIAFLAAVPWLFLALKVAGGGYLVYLGYHIWRGASEPLTTGDALLPSQPSRAGRSFVLGLTTQLSNPKTAVVYASVFASLLPRDVPQWAVVALPVLIFAIETTWYSLVAIVLSAPAPRVRYLALKKWIDRTAGTILALLGVKLIFEAPHP